jgi:hypothetical protein
MLGFARARVAAQEPWDLLCDVNFFFLVNALDKEDQRAEKRDDSAPDSHPQIFRVTISSWMGFVFPKEEINGQPGRDQADNPG